MTVDSSIPASLLYNQELLHFLLKRRLDGIRPPKLTDIDHLSYEEACSQYAALAFRRETGELTHEAFKMRWEHFQMRLKESSAAKEPLMMALHVLYEDFLEERNGEIHVKLERYVEWQNLVANINLGPLAAYAAEMASRRSLSWNTEERNRVRQAMLNQNALCYPYDILVETYIREKGLNDAHLHINAAAFAEYNWLCAISNPEKAANPFSLTDGSWKKMPLLLQAVRQQFCEVFGNNPSTTILRHLRIARNLRAFLRRYITEFPENRRVFHCHDLRTWAYEKNEKIISCIDDLGDEHLPDIFVDRPWPAESHSHVILRERDWMSRLIHHLLEGRYWEDDPLLIRYFHIYLLIMNEYCSLHIQRETQKGFEYFSSSSHIPMPVRREEQYYLESFLHYHGSNPQSDVHYLDARFAPMDKESPSLKRLATILRAYARYLVLIGKRAAKEGLLAPPSQELESMIPEGKLADLLDIIHGLCPPAPFRYLKLGLTIHFNKRKWNRSTKSPVRYAQNRDVLYKHARVLKGITDTVPGILTFLRSIDAASNERNVPPSVFAPCFRYCRRELGMERITFHCGEDFPHLLTGLRSMNDALRFLKLRKGDRLGHGTALGMNPQYWRENQKDTPYMLKEDRMLDLLYAYEMLRQEHDFSEKRCNDIKNECMAIAHDIFDTCTPCIDLIILQSAMEMRDLCPLLLRRIFPAGTTAETVKTFKENPQRYLAEHDVDVWGKDTELQYTIEKLKQASPYAILALLAWQCDSRTWEVGGQIIRIALQKDDDELFRILQQRMMHDFVEAEVVIETLITSNLRIACYRKASDHHAVRWLLHKPEQFHGEPDLLLCFGSDDPSIFSCDAKADFYLLYASLCEHGVKEHNAIQLLDRVNERGRIYSFPSPKEPLTLKGLQILPSY